ncbi:phosphatidyl inositol kinase [Linnemannia schmuckeri]|uniref:1-phosphatidylinositol 4-kinase n=1 Tax=Linnemannia schmuckeri TaxID=64567 RepID=A0A9P5RV27_9FUNG|nr:phosphatidyl inositol kinase [Linnemannia schmuckeri]
MSSNHGYLPLGQEDTSADHNNEDHSENNTNNKNSSTHRPDGHVAVTMSQQDPPTLVPPTTTGATSKSSVITTPPGPRTMDNYTYTGRSFAENDSSTSEGAKKLSFKTFTNTANNGNTTTTTTTTTTTSTGLRPAAQSIVSAPAAPTTTTVEATSSAAADASPSPLPAFQFPRVGAAKNKSFLGLKDRLASTTSAPTYSQNEGNSNSSNALDTTYARLVGSKSLGAGLLGNNKETGSASDLFHIRPKQHPYTTEDGPRGIRRSQRRQVLREIRPDLHNLPEELLREQARSGATVDAITNSQPIIGDGTGLLPTSHVISGSAHLQGPGSNTGSGSGTTGSSHQGERGTLLGSGDGLGLGFGVGGKANATPSRWSRPRLGGSRRQRRASGSGLGRENDQRVIQSSVFKPVEASVDGGKPVEPAPALTPDHAEPMNSTRFVAIVNSVKEAIHSGIQPLRIAQGSSGSYFCRNLDGKIVGVFKPKNEEPYGQLNPKWANLIPNLGYISESATSLVDRRLKLNIVPSTEVVWLSSSAFHYDYLDRRAAQLQRGAKPLPDKVGSFQLFLNGFKDANLFMRDHPWPLESPVGDANGKGKTWRRSAPESIHSHQEADGASLNGGAAGSTNGGHGHGPDKPGFNWTPALQQQFREQFEKMIILDYLIRNTDRGLDNWMIRYCEKEGISIVTAPAGGTQKSHLQQEPARRNSRVGDLLGLYSDRGSVRSNSSLREGSSSRNGMLATPPGTPPRSNLSRPVSGMELLQDEDNVTEHTGLLSQERSGSPTKRSSLETEAAATSSTIKDTKLTPAETMEAYYGPNHVHVAAIDNGLAFPFKHPDSWRSYPYGWLFLPRPLISQPFTKATRDHFLPLLSSPVWWRETIADLRRLFSIDSDFDQGMFDKQMAVMKGQGWNIVETLKNLDQGPMDLCRRVALVVWDEEVTLEPGVSPAQLGLLPSPGLPIQTEGQVPVTQPQEGVTGYGSMGHGQKYTTTQPKAMTMDAKSGYLNYGSMMSSVGDRLSNIKTLSTSSTAVGEGAASSYLGSESLKAKNAPHLVIDMEENASSLQLPKHDSFRQVVSDGEYDLEDEDDEDDDEDYDDDAFSYDEEHDGFSDDLTESTGDLRAPAAHRRSRSSSSQLTDPQRTAREGMVSIDMALAENGERPCGARNHCRRQSHQSEGGRSPRRRPAPTPAQPLPQETTLIPPSQGLVHPMDESTVAAVVGASQASSPRNHRRSRTEQDDRTGTIRFEAVTSPSGDADPVEAVRTRLSKVGTQESTSSSGRGAVDEPERGRGFFARGYGAVSGSRSGENGISERPKWADRLRRGLSFDGHLLAVEGFGLGQAARRERKLRKQRQRERELRERRVVLVERIEPVTKNLPYFSWW